MSQTLNPPEGELREHADRGSRLPYAALAACVALSAAAVAAAVYFAPSDFRIPLAAGASAAAIALCAAIAAAVHFRRATVGLRRVAEHAAHAVADAEAEARAAAVEAQTATAEAQATMAAAHAMVAQHAAGSKASDHRRAAAMAAFAGAAGRMQAMTTSMLAELREMEHRHADPTMLADLLQLDHRTAQAGRLADSIAVLSGARSGRRWAKPIAMESILRGAMGRIAGYQRVRLRAVADIAVSGHAAEGVMHALAELLDNACNFSPPTTEVHVYAAEVPAGVVITIEDSGLVMSESALRRAEAAVSTTTGDGGRSGIDLSQLTGTRLGLAVVGHLARKHGLTVSYRPSAIGGTAVVVVVPRDLTVRVERGQNASLTTGAQPAARTTANAAAAESLAPSFSASSGSASSGSAALGAADSGNAPSRSTTSLPASSESAPALAVSPDVAASESALPRRRRGSTLAAVHPGGLSAPEPAAPTLPPSKPSALGAFQRAVNGRDTGRTAPPPPAPSFPVEND